MTFTVVLDFFTVVVTRPSSSSHDCLNTRYFCKLPNIPDIRLGHIRQLGNYPVFIILLLLVLPGSSFIVFIVITSVMTSYPEDITNIRYRSNSAGILLGIVNIPHLIYRIAPVSASIQISWKRLHDVYKLRYLLSKYDISNDRLVKKKANITSIDHTL